MGWKLVCGPLPAPSAPNADDVSEDEGYAGHCCSRDSEAEMGESEEYLLISHVLL